MPGAIKCTKQFGSHAVAPGATCGSPELLARSYTLPARWPLESMQLVMETSRDTCDLYRDPYICCMFSSPDGFTEPESHIRGAIVSLIPRGCGRREQGDSHSPCTALDLGANNGWFSLMMLQLGAHVTAVEPQPDFALALKQSAEINCVGSRLRVFNARACIVAEGQSFARKDTCMAPLNASGCGPPAVKGWRWGGSPSQLFRRYGMDCAAKTGLPSTVSGVELTDVLLGAGRRSGVDAGSSQAAPPLPRAVDIDLIKMDADGPEGAWLALIEAMITQGKLRVGAMIVEGSHLQPELLRRLDTKHGYTFYRLDEHDARRFITRDGWDAYSPPGTYAGLNRLAEEHRKSDRRVSKYSVASGRHYTTQAGKPAADGISRLELETELLAVRAMLHVFRVRRGLSLQGWSTILNPVLPGGCEHYCGLQPHTNPAPLAFSLLKVRRVLLAHVRIPSHDTDPPQLALTLEGNLTEPAFPHPERHLSPEAQAAAVSGIFPDARVVNRMKNVTLAKKARKAKAEANHCEGTRIGQTRFCR